MNAEQILKQMLRSSLGPDDTASSFIEEFKQRVQNECQQLDGKRCGMVWHRKDGRITEGFFILIPQDDLAVSTIKTYINLCHAARCDQAQIDGANRVLARFQAWKQENEGQAKVPDLKPDDNAE